VVDEYAVGESERPGVRAVRLAFWSDGEQPTAVSSGMVLARLGEEQIARCVECTVVWGVELTGRNRFDAAVRSDSQDLVATGVTGVDRASSVRAQSEDKAPGLRRSLKRTGLRIDAVDCSCLATAQQRAVGRKAQALGVVQASTHESDDFG